MRWIALASLLSVGCFDYDSLSSGSTLDGNTADDGGAVPDGSTPPAEDLAGADLVGVDLAEPPMDLAPPPADMTCSPQYTHSNGLSATWTDCVPLGTYNDAQALKACAASFNAAVTCIYPSAGASCVGKAIYGYTSASDRAFFVYSGTYQGKVIHPGGDCTLPGTTTNWN